MDNQKVLETYLIQFYKVSSQWAATSKSYAERNKKEPFDKVMRDMDSYARRYMGMNNYKAVYGDLLLFMTRHEFVQRLENGNYDVSEERYLEFKSVSG